MPAARPKYLRVPYADVGPIKVKAAGVSWWAYQRFMKQHEKVIEAERLVRVPATLDLTPYRDEHDFALLNRLVQKERACLRHSD
jgi:hypothetical protein